MSEQSGGGPITREQVERAAKAELSHDVDDILGPLWTTHAPKYVRDAWHRSWRAEIGDTEHAALTRWRDELAAAEPVRRVARWDAYALAYAAKNADGAVHYYQHADRAKADGYEIEGAPEPVAEDSPERLRERREALGLSHAVVANLMGMGAHAASVIVCVEPGGSLARDSSGYSKDVRTRYAAALSAEEARRSAVGAWAANGGVLHYSPPAEPERPAPRFKVGDWVRHGTGMAWRVDEVRDLGDCYAFYGALGGFIEGPEVTLTLTTRDLAYDEPASPPAPEVVPRGWSRHASGSYWCLHCNATGDAPGDQDCSNCGGLGWRGEPGATPEPIDDSSPERLRERREALGWSMTDAALVLGGACDERDISHYEAHDDACCMPLRARYAAALSAAEAERVASKPHMTPAFRKAIAEMRAGGASLSEVADAYSLGIGEVSEALDAESMELERPAPRFKVGDLDPALRETALAATRMLHCGKWPLSLPRVRELPGFDAWNSGPLTSTDWIAQLEALLAEPTSPPAPEVVDVPQPRIVVKRCDEVEAEWTSADATILIVTHDALDDAIFVPLPLLRAMLAAIDAQQGGAS